MKATARPRTLIIGGDATIGRELKRYLLAAGHDVIATTRRRDRECPTTFFLNMAEDLSEIELPRVNTAVICAAITRFSDCRNFPELARRVNVEAPISLSKKLVARGTRVLLLSTAAVFDCLSPNAKGNDRRAPRSVYGRLKAEAEESMLDLGHSATVLRLTKVLLADQGVLARWIDDLRDGQTIRAFTDHRLSPITLDDTLKAIGAITEHTDGGVYQLSGGTDISFEEAARHLAARVGTSQQKVIGVKAADNGVPSDEITPYTSLDTDRLNTLVGYNPPHPRTVIDNVFAATFAKARTQ